MSQPTHSPITAGAGADATMSSIPQSSPPSSDPSLVFSIRIVSLDYYMAPPVPGLDFCESLCFQGRRVEQVPVIRIYGSTLAGQKACLHVHQALPYLYIPCSEVQTSNKGQSYTSEISYAIEKALQLKGTCGLRRQRVHGCCLVRAKKFYGYHSTEELFVKIYLYNPADVARVAALLLGGSILNRSIQPYESHIPFLLQFMVDYNLYGMAHLHTSKVMFRHPLPDKFVPRTARYTVQNDFAFEKTSVSASLQADSSLEGHAALWLSSTVPKEWTWATLANDNEGPDRINTVCIKKQSNCELEGDSSVDDILNQRAKLYSSLSQTGPDMKLVQSLIPIWEEEYGRSGVQEFVASPEKKPLPDAVLRGMCDGLYDHVLSHIHTEAERVISSKVSAFEGEEKLEQQSKSFTLVESAEDQKPCHSGVEPFLNPKGKRMSTTLEGSSSVEGDASSQGIYAFAGSSPSSQKIVPSAMIGSKEGKVADVEALELLNWLTSSQVAQDFSLDDELAHEAILSPLFSSKNYEEALEKAHLDYEIASQQECQEILDSLDDFQFGVLKEKSASASQRNCSIDTPLVNVIPQVDGSSDDQSCFPRISETSDKRKMDMSHMTSSDVVGKHMTNRFVGKQRRNHLLWGPLPFSIKRKKPEDSCSFNVDPNDLPPYGVNNVTDAGSSPGSETGEICEALDSESSQQLIERKEGRQVTGSLRDLMRKKHCYHVEQFEHGGHPSGGGAAGSECNTILPMEKADSQSRDSNEDSMMPFEAPQIKAFILKRHGPSTCLEGRTSTGTYTGGPSEVCQSADWHDQQKGKLSFMPSADCFLVDTLNKHLDPHKAPFTMEPSVGSVEPGDENLLQSDPGLTDSRKLSPIVFPECSKENFNHESLGSLKLESDSAAHTFIKDCYKESRGIDSRASYIPAVEESVFCENCYSSTTQWNNTCKTFTEAHLSNFININPADTYSLKALQINDSGHGKCDTRICNSCAGTQKEPACAKFVEMTFNRKPPLLEEISGLLENSQFPAAGVLGNMNDAYLSDAERQRPDLPPFFSDNKTEKMDYKFLQAEDYLEAVRGVPLHFQNDGSFSYLLTFAVSPPSRYSVCHWLLGHAEQNISCQSDEACLKVDNCSGHVSESHNFCSHDEKTSTSPRAMESMSAKLDSQGSAGNPYFDSPLLPVLSCTKNLIENFSDKCDTSVNSGKVLHSEVVETNKLQGASLDREGNCDTSQISGANERSKHTPLSQIGFRDPASTGGGQNLTLLSMEILAESRGNLLPDPQFDAINLIALAVQEDTDDNAKLFVLLCGGGMNSSARNVDGISGCTFLIFPEERCLFDQLVKMIGLFDPDILLGWEIQGSSIGYLAERAAHLGIRLLKSISRTPAVESKHETKASSSPKEEVTNEFAFEGVSASIVLEDAIIEDEWGRNHASGIHVGGRIVLNVWRLMRSELKLSMYSIESVAEEVLRRKIPCIPVRTLNKWFSSGSQRARFRCIEYVMERANLNLQIMNHLDMINRTSELARVFGIDFFSVLSRGSQFRVESMLLRLAHSQNYLAISPGNQQVALQPAMECLPLVLEPESGFYADPVVVLDFQSLYPSMIIAYNLCYCTCLGRGLSSRGNVLGVSSFSPDPRLLIDLKEQMLLSPNGVMYVPSKIRRGVLPRLLDEILSTRIMIKKAMKKLSPCNQVLQRVLNARQLALKLIANVTYGYTAAGFSGRMPCAELADSIVQCGRKTLEMAISFINSHGNWNGRVVYGDTDSMFVLLRGRSLEDAFKIGNEIALTISSMNPKPVTLKMEKVYYPCFLLTKKRYVGYSYESPTQEIPSFDAKGIETVRRDTCPAVAKTMEKSLRIFFEHQDATKVKSYLQRQWKRILSGKVSLQDFVFAKEVRLGTYSSRASSLPPGAIVAVKAMKADPRSEPRYGERVPYVVVHGEPGARLVDMVVDPLELLEINSPYRLNDTYYINKQIIPALQRAFGLLKVDLNQWFSEIPRPVRPTVAKRHSCESSLSSAVHGFDDAKDTSKRSYTRNRIDKYYLSKHCAVCGNLVQASAHLCDGCSNKGPLVASVVVGRTSKLERDIHHLSAICRHCGGGDWIVERGVKCTSLACSVFYERRKVQKELQSLSSVATDAGLYPRCVSEWF